MNETHLLQGFGVLVPVIGSGDSLYGLVYAPTSIVFVNEPVFGTIIGSSVTLNSGGAVHFDQSSSCGSPKTAQLDQSFTGPSDLSDGLYGRPVLMAQSYTAGISGALQGVAIDVTAIDPTLVARIQIEAITGGAPSNTVLGQARASKGGDLALTTVIPFTSSIAQVAGQQYAILVDYPEAPTFFNGIQNTASWNGSDGTPNREGLPGLGEQLQLLGLSRAPKCARPSFGKVSEAEPMHGRFEHP